MSPFFFRERTLRLRCAASESKAGVSSTPQLLALFLPRRALVPEPWSHLLCIKGQADPRDPAVLCPG